MLLTNLRATPREAEILGGFSRNKGAGRSSLLLPSPTAPPTINTQPPMGPGFPALTIQLIHTTGNACFGRSNPPTPSQACLIPSVAGPLLQRTSGVQYVTTLPCQPVRVDDLPSKTLLARGHPGWLTGLAVCESSNKGQHHYTVIPAPGRGKGEHT